MDKFDTSVSLLISATVGAGVFALPFFAKEVGLLSVFVIAIAFAYMLGLGYLIIEMSPGTVEEEVERYMGVFARNALVAVETAVVFLALVAYSIALKVHLGVSDLLLLSILALPLVMELSFPANFTNFIAFFTLAFVSLLSLVTIPRMELPVHLFLTTSGGSFPLMGYGAVIPLFLASVFAFYGHNMIPRIRNILRNKIMTKKAFYTALAIIFLLYLPFSISVSGTKVSGIATAFLANSFSEPLASIIDLLAVMIFFTSFILLGMHLFYNFGGNRQSLGLVLGGTFILYFLSLLIGASFGLIVAAAGLGATFYALLVALSAHFAKKMFPVPQIIIGTTLVAWLFLLIQVF